MADNRSKTGLTERLRRRDSGVLMIVAFVGLAMMLFAFVMMMAR